MIHPLRKIRSFVRREGRITPGQQSALTEYWPRWGIDFSGSYNWSELFNRNAPLAMDIGFGNGESVVALALAHPDWNILAVEVYRPGIGHLLNALEKNHIQNVRVMCHDAVEVLHTAIEADSLTYVQIFFPDPWPKKRHHKRRLIQPDFVECIANKLKVGGVLALATDWQEYAEHMLLVLSNSSLKNKYENEFAPRDECRPLTKFEKKGEKAGHLTWDLKFTRLQ